MNQAEIEQYQIWRTETWERILEIMQAHPIEDSPASESSDLSNLQLALNF